MAPLSLNQILVLYTWFPLAALLFFILLIARFYQRFSGERTFFRLYLVPIFLFGAAAVRYASIDGMLGDGLGDLLYGAAGVLLLMLTLWLYRRMIWKRPHPEAAPRNAEQ